MALFKDIYPYLSKLYPDKKIYIISDHHFFHRNIIKYSRTEFADLDEMHDFIIESHNKVVNPDDIVIFLGDFSFNYKKIARINEKLNGIKFLVMGNHDNKRIVRNYRALGFENVFITPVKLDNSFLSHQPLIKEEDLEADFEIKARSFSKTKNKLNYYGHIHDPDLHPEDDKFVNVTLENQNYNPLFYGYTEVDKRQNKDLINSEVFSEVVTETSRKNGLNKDVVIKDFIYASILASLSKYQNRIYVYGSYGYYKKYDQNPIFSDLDLGLLYDDEISKTSNYKLLKVLSNKLVTLINSKDLTQVEFFKRYQGLHILLAHYLNGYGDKVTAPIDLCLTPIKFHKNDDFVLNQNSSIIERTFPELNSDFNLPNYELMHYSDNTEIIYLIIQYFFQKGYADRKSNIINKLKYLTTKTQISNPELFEDQFIRHFIKNVYLLCTRSRYKEIEHILNVKKNLNPYIDRLNPEIRELMRYIIMDKTSKFNECYEDIFNLTREKRISDNCKKLIKKI